MGSYRFDAEEFGAGYWGYGGLDIRTRNDESGSATTGDRCFDDNGGDGRPVRIAIRRASKDR